MIAPKEIIRTKRRSLALTINEKGELIVKAPYQISIDKIYSFIKEKEKWIEKKQKAITSVLDENKEIVSYNSIFLLGNKYKVIEIGGVDIPYLTKEYLAIPPTNSLKEKMENIREFFFNNTKILLLHRVEKFAKNVGVQPQIVKIIDSKTKWGMCDSKKQVYINWKCIMLSPDLIDYIIIHELCHIKQLNHSKEFWKIVYSQMNFYKEEVDLLKKSNFLIKLF